MLTPTLLKAARSLAGLSVLDLARAADVGVITIKRFESGLNASASTRERLMMGLNNAGVTIIPNGDGGLGPGVRLSSPVEEA